MSQLDALLDRDEELLRLAVEDLREREMAERLGLSPKTVRNRLTSIYKTLGVKSLHGAAALYANRMGLRGEPLSALGEVQALSGFTLGRLQGAAVAVSSAFDAPRDVTCLVLPGSYRPPRELAASRVEQLRRQAAEAGIRRGSASYEDPGGADDLYVVRRLNPANENYAPLTLRLQTAKYYTYIGLKDYLTSDEYQRYRVDPMHIVDPALPLPLGTSLFIIAGRPSKLVVLRRAASLATYGGYYASAVQGWGEPSKDMVGGGDGRRFDFVYSMHREMGEELGKTIPIGDFRRSVRLIGMDYFIPQYSFAIVGYIRLPGKNPQTICEQLALSKEGIHELVAFPSSSRDLPAFEVLCHHLLTQSWLPGETLMLTTLLERLYGKYPLYELLGAEIDV